MSICRVDMSIFGSWDFGTNVSTDFSLLSGGGSLAEGTVMGTLDRMRFILATTTSSFISGIW